MANKKKTQERNAVDAYLTHKSTVYQLLRGIKRELDLVYDRKSPEEINWGDVGSLVHIQEVLQDIYDSMTGQNEYSS